MLAYRAYCSLISRSATQRVGLDLALRILEGAVAPRTTVQSPLTWSASPDWKLDYCNIERLTPQEIARRRAEFDEGKTQARSVREEASGDIDAGSGTI